jgi:hypothetical protein
MKIGINWSSPRRLPVVRALLANGRASFCEILIDNFLHCGAEDIASLFPGTPISFHIMNSQFIQRDVKELSLLGATLRGLIRNLNPLYVSDHLALFSCEGRRLPMPMEVDYARDFALARERVGLWQELLGVPLLIENYPSILDEGRAQPDFLGALAKETGAGVLFDLSNAVVANKNCGVPLAAWSDIIRRAHHFHAAGYTLSDTKPPIVRDSHDAALSPDTLIFLRGALELMRDPETSSIVVERDGNIEEESWSRDLEAVRAEIPWTTAA